MTVFWLAHAYANLVGRAVDAKRSAALSDLTVAMGEEWPIVEAAVVPCLALALGAFGPLSDYAAFDLALGLCVASMATWGLIASREAGLSRLATTVTTLVSTALGLGIVALKLVVE
ncbi:MAG: hypothetical protein ACRD12_07850 [Acidimicrobiales bacterium]